MKNHHGFTLIEMAIVLSITALALGSGLTLLFAQQDQRRIEENNTRLTDAKEALTGYALSHAALDGHPYLPCPDRMSGNIGSNLANDGIEDRTGATCDMQEGNLPWVSLGLSQPTDAWGNRLRYRVSSSYASSAAGIQLNFSGDINVLDSASAGNTLALTIPALILSHGKNGLGAINATGAFNPAPSGSDEAANTDANTTFVSRYPSTAKDAAPGGEFDDQLVWLSQYALFNRLVQAGRLP